MSSIETRRAIVFSALMMAAFSTSNATAQTAAEPADQAAELPEIVVETEKSAAKKKQATKAKPSQATPAPQAVAQPVPEPVAEPPPAAEGSQLGLTKPYAGGQVATGGRFGLLGNVSYADSPFSATSYTSELIANQQSDSIGDVLLNDPTVRVAQGFGNFQEVYIIRGFPVFSDDITLNGLYGIVPRQSVAANLVERVEILRGVSAFVNGVPPGSSGVGGTVNLIPKRASFEDLTRVTVGFESNGQAIGALDISRRAGAAWEWGIRFGATGRTGETSVDNQDRELAATSLGIDYTGRSVRFTADLGYQDNRLDQPRPQVRPANAVPNPPDADKNYAQPWTYSDDKHLFFVSRAEVDLTDSVTAWAAGGFRLGDEANVLSTPTATSDGTLSASRFDNTREDTAFSGDAGIRAKFDTGAVSHRVVLSGSATHLDSKNAFAFSNFAGFAAGTLNNPIAVAAPPANAFLGGTLSNPLTTAKTRTSSIAISDTLGFFDDRVLLTLGGRYQDLSQKSFNATTGILESNVDGSEVTPAVGLVVKPWWGTSLFANYAEALQSGEIAPASSGGVPILNAGEVLDPYVSEQYEFGAKIDGGNFGATLSWFSISQQQAIVENQILQTSGEQINRGVELSFYGEPVSGLRLLGGFTVVNAKLENTEGRVNDGKRAIGVPRFQSNLGIEWDLPFVSGLTLDGRLIYTGDQYINAANTFENSSWTRVDLGLRYETQWNETPITLRARVENVANESYWASVGGSAGANYLVQGAPRTFMTNVTMDF